MSESTLSKLLDLRAKLVAEHEALETEANRKAAEILVLDTKTLPDELADLGVDSVTLKDGRKLTIKDYVSVKIPDEARAQAFQWMRDNGHGDLIKHTFTVAMSGSAQEADEGEINSVRASLEERGVPFSEDENVHSSTLRAFASEQLKAGKTLPSDAFKVFQGKIAQIKK